MVARIYREVRWEVRNVGGGWLATIYFPGSGRGVVVRGVFRSEAEAVEYVEREVDEVEDGKGLDVDVLWHVTRVAVVERIKREGIKWMARAVGGRGGWGVDVRRRLSGVWAFSTEEEAGRWAGRFEVDEVVMAIIRFKVRRRGDWGRDLHWEAVEGKWWVGDDGVVVKPEDILDITILGGRGRGMRKAIKRKGPEVRDLDVGFLVRVAKEEGGRLEGWDEGWLAEMFWEFTPHEIGWGEVGEEVRWAMGVVGEHLVKLGKVEDWELPPKGDGVKGEEDEGNDD